MARETRALPGRRQRGLGAAKAGSGKSVGTLSHRPLPGLCRARWGWPERLEPYRGGGSGVWGPRRPVAARRKGRCLTVRSLGSAGRGGDGPRDSSPSGEEAAGPKGARLTRNRPSWSSWSPGNPQSLFCGSDPQNCTQAMSGDIRYQRVPWVRKTNGLKQNKHDNEHKLVYKASCILYNLGVCLSKITFP